MAKKLLTKEGEDRLLEAAQLATAMVDDDNMSTDDAVSKVAMDMQLTPEMIHRVAEAYNTGRTTFQRETSSCLLDKLAHFPLVDPDKVIAEIYPTVAKSCTKEASFAIDVVDDFYSKPPQELRYEDQFLQKQARAHLDALVPPKQVEKKASPAVQEINKDIVDARRFLNDARTKVSAAKDAFMGSLDNLTNYFSKFASDRLPIGLVGYNADVMYGPRGKALIEYVEQNTKLSFEKEAATADNITWRVRRDLPPYTIIEDCLKKAEDLEAAQAKYEEENTQYSKSAADLYKSMKPKVVGLEEENFKVAEGSKKKSILKSAAIRKEANLLSLLGAGTAGSALSGGEIGKNIAPPTIDLVDKQIRNLSSPDHENELRAIRSKALLTNLMSNDDVLAGHHMEDVIDAYNKFSTLSPRGAQQPAAVQAFLRNYLSQGGHIPMFETMEAANLEKTLLQTEKGSRDD